MSTATSAAGYEAALDVERSHFDRLASQRGDIWWGSVTVSGRRRLQRRADWMARLLRPFGDPRVLEVGCGTGALTKPLLDRLPWLRVHACDLAPRAVDVARQRCAGFANVSFDVCDIVRDARAGVRYDAVIGNSILHHLPLREALDALRGVLRQGGSFLFFEPNMLNPQVALERHVRWIGRLLDTTPGETAFVRWRLRRALTEHGFTSVRITPFDFLHPLVPGALAPAVEAAGRGLEHLPGLREIAGSLMIQAVRADA